MEGRDTAQKNAFNSMGRREMSVMKVLIYGTMIFEFSILTFLKYIK